MSGGPNREGERDLEGVFSMVGSRESGMFRVGRRELLLFFFVRR